MPHHHRSVRPQGFTLVELLVVIAIIGVLVALLLPAVQSAREASRRASCTNNLKQLALAVHNYHDAFQLVPCSMNWAPTPNTPPQQRGWIVATLPFFERQDIYDLFAESHFEVYHANVAKARQTMLSALRCPSDGTGHNMKLNKNQAQFIGTEVALTNYKGVIGDPNMGGGGYGSADTHGEDQNNGMFWRRSWKNPINFRDVLDGTSNTFMIGEDVPKFNYHSAWFFSNGDYCSCHRPLNFFAKPAPPDDATGHHHWPRDMGFRSQHPGISQFALVDGSVRGVRQNIDRDQYRAFCTRAGGESIASE